MDPLRAGGRRLKILSALDLGDKAEAGLALVPDGINALQERIAQDIKGIVTTRLDSTVPVPLRRDRKGQVLLLDRELLVAHGNTEVRQIIGFGGGGEQPALLLVVVLGTRNGLVQCLADLVGDEGESGAGVSNGGVVGEVDLLAGDSGTR